MSDCLFCKITAGEIPADIVYEDDLVLAFRDINPVAPVHILVIPRAHITSLLDLPADAPLQLALTHALQQIAQQEGIADSGFRVVTNIGRDGGQEIPHLHWHLLGGRRLKWEF